MFRVSVKPWFHSDTLLWDLCPPPEDVISLSLGATWNFSKGTGLPRLGYQIMGHKGPVRMAYIHQDRKGSNLF